MLSLGEIEDYYPDEALAKIAGGATDNVQGEKDKRRVVFDDPSTFAVVASLFREYRQDLCGADPTRLEKVTKRAYNQTLQKIREQGSLATNMAKTGVVLGQWLKLSKPIIALRVAQWFEEHPDNIPSTLRELVEWVLTGLDGVES